MFEDRFAKEEEYGHRHWRGRERHPHGLEFWKEAAERRFGGRHLGHRLFDHGDLRFVILKLIADKPSYGYELIKVIEESLGGAYSPSPGIVYPTLTMLEEMGFAAVAADESGKKLYSITPEGRSFLQKNKGIVDAIFSRMNEAAAVHRRGRAPQIERAIQNLRFTMKLKTSSGALTGKQVREIAEAIDEAARKIEQC